MLNFKALLPLALTLTLAACGSGSSSGILPTLEMGAKA